MNQGLFFSAYYKYLFFIFSTKLLLIYLENNRLLYLLIYEIQFTSNNVYNLTKMWADHKIYRRNYFKCLLLDLNGQKKYYNTKIFKKMLLKLMKSRRTISNTVNITP